MCFVFLFAFFFVLRSPEPKTFLFFFNNIASLLLINLIESFTLRNDVVLFNPLMLGGKKRSYVLKKPAKLRVCLSTYSTFCYHQTLKS